MSEHFPFSLEDIQAWIFRKKDGTVVRFNLIDAAAKPVKKAAPAVTTNGGAFWSGFKKTHYSDWCDHDPDPTKQEPIFSSDGIGIWVADAPGARKVHDLYDVAIDGGGVLTVAGEHDYPILCGDPGLRGKMERYVARAEAKGPASGTKILKIRWTDRDAPPVWPEFWPQLLKQLKALRRDDGSLLKVLTICQGGHGRSGSAAAALIMCLTDYTPLDVLTHIRALHCARAIESKIQHEYLNALAKHLGRTPNALEADQVKSFKERFLASESSWAAPYKARVEAGKGAINSTREAGYL